MSGDAFAAASVTRRDGAVSAGELLAWAVLVAALILLAYTANAASGRPPDDDVLYRYATAIAALVQYALMFAIVLLIARGVSRETLGFRQPKAWPRALGLTLAALTGVWAAGAVLNVFLKAGEEQGLVPDGWDSSRAGAYAASFLAVAFVGPLVEELLYRGAGLTLLARWGTPLAVAATSIGFGLGHGLLLALPALIWFGVVTALLRLKTDSIYPCMLVHCTFNATSLIVAVAI